MLLSRQHPTAGLMPAGTTVNAHGNDTDAWVRDNVYSILAVRGLRPACPKRDWDGGAPANGIGASSRPCAACRPP